MVGEGEKALLRQFAVEFSMRKGNGPDRFRRVIFVGLDDLGPEVTDFEAKEMAILEAKTELRKSPDFRLYGECWRVVDCQNA